MSAAAITIKNIKQSRSENIFQKGNFRVDRPVMNINPSHTAQRSYRFVDLEWFDLLDWLTTDLENSSVVQDLLEWKCIGGGFGEITDEDRTRLNNYYNGRNCERYGPYITNPHITNPHITNPIMEGTEIEELLFITEEDCN
jgi:hypothetical protein